MSITDFLEQHHGGGDPQRRKAWLGEVQGKLNCQDHLGSVNVRLFVADLFLDLGKTRSDQRTSWASWKTDRMGEEGFVLPIAADRHLSNSEVFYGYFRSVLSARLKKQTISRLDLNAPHIKEIIANLLRDILITADDFCVISLNQEQQQQNVANTLWFHGNVLKQTKFVTIAKEDLSSLLSKKWNLLGATVCEFYSSAPFVRTHIKADSPDEIAEWCFSADIGVHRFIVISSWPDGCATQVRQAVLANLFLNIILWSEQVL
jgi:hypothetical protein